MTHSTSSSGVCRDCRWWLPRVHSALADQTAQKPGECHGIPTFPITRADDWCSLVEEEGARA